MESVEDVQGLGAMLADEFEIGLPDVGADEADAGNDFLPHGVEESLK